MKSQRKVNPQKSAKCRQKPQTKRGSYIPKPVRGRVIARHVTGESNRKIATEEGIDRATVGRILSQKEVVQMIARSQQALFELLPKAVNVYQKTLSSRDERVRLAAATRIVEGLGVLSRRGPGQTIELATLASSPEQQAYDRRYRMISEMVSMIFDKSERYDLPLPETLSRLKTVMCPESAKVLRA